MAALSRRTYWLLFLSLDGKVPAEDSKRLGVGKTLKSYMVKTFVGSRDMAEKKIRQISRIGFSKQYRCFVLNEDTYKKVAKIGSMVKYADLVPIVSKHDIHRFVTQVYE